MAYSTYWQQVGVLKAGMAGTLRATGPGYCPIGEPVPVSVVSQKNRGTYGSGVNDMLLSLKQPNDAARVAGWPVGATVRFRLANRQEENR